MVSVFALSRLGFTVLLLSPKLASKAIISLLKETKCDKMVHQNLPLCATTITHIQHDYALKTILIAERFDYDKPTCTSVRFQQKIDREQQSLRYAMICHSSGSTGLPKPIYQLHSTFVSLYPRGPGNAEFCTLPWYHTLGNKLCINAMFWRKTAYLYAANVPMTTDGLIDALTAAKPAVLHAVPYVIKLLGEKEEGIEVMKSCTEVVFGGSHCPDDLGDYLVEKGVQLATSFGGYALGIL